MQHVNADNGPPLVFLHCLEHARKNFTHQGTCADSVQFGTYRFHRYRCHVGTGSRYPTLSATDSCFFKFIAIAVKLVSRSAIHEK